MTPKEQRFIEEYPVDLNGTQAAIRAGYSAKTAGQAASRLLKDVKIRVAIDERLDVLSEGARIEVERIVRELNKIAFADAGDVFTWGPTGIVVKDSAKLTPEQRSIVQSVSETTTKEGGTVKVSLYDKQRALELLGRYRSMWVERHEHTGKDGGPIRTETVEEVRESVLERLAGLVR